MSVYISKQKEAEYVSTNDIFFRRLANGVVLVGAYGGRDDWVGTEVYLQLCDGAYFDTDVPVGSLHMLEHFIHKPLMLQASIMDCQVGASTSAVGMYSTLEGPYVEADEYGMKPLLTTFVERSLKPLEGNHASAEMLDYEKRVVLSEIQERKSSHDFLVRECIEELFYQDDAAMRTQVPGTEDSVASISWSDLQKTQQRIVLPRMLVSFFYGGQKPEGEKIFERLVESFSQKGGEKTQAERIALDELDRYTNEVPQEVVKDTGLGNGMQSILLAWKLSYQRNSKESFAFTMLEHALSQRLFLHGRERGWGYSIGLQFLQGLSGEHVVCARVDVPSKQVEVEQFLSALHLGWQQVLVEVERDIDELLLRERHRILTVPMSRNSQLNWSISGLIEKDQLIDPKLIQAGYADVSKEDLLSMLERFSEKPVSIVVGDLS